MKHAAIVIFSSSVFVNSRLPLRARTAAGILDLRRARGTIRLPSLLPPASTSELALSESATGPVAVLEWSVVSKQFCLIGHCLFRLVTGMAAAARASLYFATVLRRRLFFRFGPYSSGENLSPPSMSIRSKRDFGRLTWMEGIHIAHLQLTSVTL